MRHHEMPNTPSTLGEGRLETGRALVRALGEERALRELALLAEMSLKELRQLCERPVTCSLLDEILIDLEQLNLDAWELEGE